MSELGKKIEQAIAPVVSSMSADFKSTSASKFGRRQYRNRIDGKTVPRLSATFKPKVNIDADGWGLIRFQTVRHAYILHHGHEKVSVKAHKRNRGGKTHEVKAYTKSHMTKTNWLSPIHDRYMPILADTISKVTADFTVKGLLQPPKGQVL